MRLNKNQARVLATLEPYLNLALPSERELSRELRVPQSTLSSMLIAFERWGLIKIERSNFRKNGRARTRILTHWEAKPSEQTKKEWQEDRQRALAEGTMRVK